MLKKALGLTFVFRSFEVVVLNSLVPFIELAAFFCGYITR